MKKVKPISCLMIAVYMLTIFFGAAPVIPAAATEVKDIKGHWAEKTIQKMVDQEIVAGMPDGSFKPDKQISRAEFAALVVKAFKLDDKNGKVFTDTSAHWAKDFIATANARGIVNGYSDTQFGPDDPITREQMAVMIVKAANPQRSTAALSFSDGIRVSNWAKEAVGLASANKMISGFPDGNFKPQMEATRAQAVIVISQALALATPVDDSHIYDTAGVYGPAEGMTTVKNNITIKTGKVTLQNTVINGDLMIDKAVGEGTVTLKGITVKGNTYINGGGTNSVYFIDAQTGKTYVLKDNGPIRIVVSGTTEMAELITQSSAEIEQTNLTGAGFDGIVVDKQVSGTITVNIAGVNVGHLTVHSANAIIETDAATKVGNFVANAAVTVTGSGTINDATINASGVKFAKAPTTQTVAHDITAPVVSPTGTGGSHSSSSPVVSPIIPVQIIYNTDTKSVPSADTDITSTVTGWLFRNDFIAGATLNLFTKAPLAEPAVNSNMQMIVYDQVYQSEAVVTSDFGSSQFEVVNLPAAFRIVANGGTCREEVLNEALMADYEDFDPKMDTIYINLVTTMISVYRDMHPGTGLDQATAMVKSYLCIPEWLDVFSELRGQKKYFNSDIFAQEAGGTGQIRPFIEKEVAKIDGVATHAFVSQNAGGGMQSPIGFIAGGLLNGALSTAGGAALGKGLHFIGMGSLLTDPTAKEMKEQIVELKKQMDDLQKLMTEMFAGLSALSDRNNYDQGSRQLMNLTSSIKNIREKLTALLTSPPKGVATQITRKNDIMDLIKSQLLGGNEELINDVQVGDGSGATPLMQVWSMVVKNNHAFLSSRDTDRIKAQYEYYRTMQLWLLELLTEYYFAYESEDSDYSSVQAARDKYTAHVGKEEVEGQVKGQQTLKLESKKEIPVGALIDKKQNIMIYEGEEFTYYAPDGKNWKTRAPFYGTMDESVTELNKMNTDKKLGYNNWRYIEKYELDSIFSGIGSSPITVLENRGWFKLPYGMYFTSKPIEDYVSPFFAKSYFFTTFNVDHGGSFQQSSLKGLRQAKYHWVFCRTMEPQEIDQYFW